MSVAEHEEEEQDECLCEEHGRPRPCPYCRYEALEYRAECLREERDHGVR